MICKYSFNLVIIRIDLSVVFCLCHSLCHLHQLNVKLVPVEFSNSFTNSLMSSSWGNKKEVSIKIRTWNNYKMTFLIWIKKFLYIFIQKKEKIVEPKPPDPVKNNKSSCEKIK